MLEVFTTIEDGRSNLKCVEWSGTEGLAMCKCVEQQVHSMSKCGALPKNMMRFCLLSKWRLHGCCQKTVQNALLDNTPFYVHILSVYIKTFKAFQLLLCLIQPILI